MTKKLFKLIMTLFIFSFLFSFSPANGQTVPVSPGDLIKHPDFTAVYVVGPDMKLYVFPNENIYNSWYTDFSGVKTIPVSQFANFSFGGNVTYRPGTKLVKIKSVPKVYAVEPGGILRWITTPELAHQLYGAEWKYRIDDLSDSFFYSYEFGPDITVPVHPTGTVINYPDTGTRYYIENGFKRLLDIDSFSANRFNPNFVIVTDIQYPTGDNITGQRDYLTDTTQRTEKAPADGIPAAPYLYDPGSSVGSGNNFAIRWTSVSNADSYELHRDSSSSFSSPSQIYFGSGQSYTDNLSPASSTTYYYRVRAINEDGNSSWSNVENISVTVGEVGGNPPAAPNLIDPGVSINSGENITLDWPNVSNATSYTLQRADNSTFGRAITLYTGSNSSYTDIVSPTSTGTSTYYYRVKASNAYGDSAWSNTVNILIYAPKMISGVPDLNQPPTNTTGMPHANNFCAPIASMNVFEYWEDNGSAPNINDGLAGITASEYLGFFMDTNDFGSDSRSNQGLPGTVIIDMAAGISEYAKWEGSVPSMYKMLVPNNPMPRKTSYPNWNSKTITADDISSAEAWTQYKTEINNGNPPILTFNYWNPNPLNMSLAEAQLHNWGRAISSSSAAIYDAPSEEWSWSGSPDSWLGHAVTGIGYIEDYDPDGLGAKDWAIVHDNWSATPKVIGIPWANWMALTTSAP